MIARGYYSSTGSGGPGRAGSHAVRKPVAQSHGNSDRPLIDGLILVVRRLDSLTERLCAGLRDEGFQVVNAPDGAHGLRVFRELHPAAVLTDLDVDLIRDIDLCRLIRGAPRVPIVVLACRDPEDERIAGVECGAEDCVTMACSILHLDRGRREVYVRGQRIGVPPGRSSMSSKS